MDNQITVEQIIRSGDRVAFKQYLATASGKEVGLAWVKAQAANVQDFGDLALTELTRRSRSRP